MEGIRVNRSLIIPLRRWYFNFSNIRLKIDSNDIERYLPGSGLSSFLYTGTTFAFFSLDGKTPFCTEMVIMMERRPKITHLASVKIQIGQE